MSIYKKFLPLILFPLIAINSPSLIAAEYDIDSVLADCIPTPYIIDNSQYPGEENIVHTNNLRRRTGIALVADGEPIYFTGRVVDEDCLPVEDAVVEIWHANATGFYQGPNADTKDARYDENFLGAGYAKTNNLGRFDFLTIFPGAANDKTAPRIHIKVKHKGFDEFQTLMYFPEQQSNSEDETLKAHAEDRSSLVASPVLKAEDGKYKVRNDQGDLVYQFNITLSGKSKFKHY